MSFLLLSHSAESGLFLFTIFILFAKSVSNTKRWLQGLLQFVILDIIVFSILDTSVGHDSQPIIGIWMYNDVNVFSCTVQIIPIWHYFDFFSQIDISFFQLHFTDRVCIFDLLYDFLFTNTN